MEQIKEIAAYVRNHVDNYEEYLRLALDRMDKMRCPFRMAADDGFYNEIENCVSEWAEDNGYAVDFIDGIDVEEIVLCGE